MKQKAILTIVLLYFVQLTYSQGFNMTLEGTWDNSSYSFNDCWGYTDALGNEYAIMGSRTKVIFFDITTPSSPTWIAEFTGSYPGINGANSIWRDFKTFDKYAYAVADQGSEGLMVFDLSDIHNGNVSKVYQKNDKFNRAHNIFIDVPEGKLYVIGSNTQNDGLIVYDIAENPSEPEHLASVTVSGGYIHDAYVYDNMVYASSGYDGLYIIDMTTPSNPIFKSFEKTTAAGYNHSGWPFANGNKMIVAEEVPKGLKLAIYDVSDLNNITYESSFRDPINTSGSGFPTYHNPYVIDDTLAVISSYEDGITIMNLANTSSPVRVAHYDTYTNANYNGYNGCWGAYPYFPSGTIIGSDISKGLHVLSTTITTGNTCSNGIQDDFEIDVDCGGFCNTCECSSPTDIVFTDQVAGSVKIDWTAVPTAVGYEVRYRENGTSTWTTVSSNTNSIILSGLSEVTEYDFQLRADCSNRLTPYGTSVSHIIGNCLNDAIYADTQTSGSYNTFSHIRSYANIPSNNNVEYLSGDSVILEPRFSVDTNTDFLAEVNRPCGIATFTGQAEVLEYNHIEPAKPSHAFQLINRKNAEVLYIISNNEENHPFTIDVLDIEGTTIHSSIHTINHKLIKLPKTARQHSVRITKGDAVYNIAID